MKTFLIIVCIIFICYFIFGTIYMPYKKKPAEYNKAKTNNASSGIHNQPIDKTVVSNNIGKRTVPIIEYETPQDMLEFDMLPYSFIDCPVIHFPPSSMRVYLIDKQNQSEATNAILHMNEIIADTRKKDSSIPNFQITDKHIRFTPGSNLEMIDYSYFIFNPKTKTGRKSKYPLQIHLETLSSDERYVAMGDKGKQAIHGTIFYLADGSIGKAELYCWKNQTLYTIKWFKDR